MGRALVLVAALAAASGAHAAGWSVRGSCVSGDVSAAVQADCLQNYPVTLTKTDGTVLHLACEPAGGSDALVYVHAFNPTTGASAAAQYTQTRTFGACDDEAVRNDLLQFWGIALVALAGVWGMRTFILRLLVPQ